jgi:hypothetical protein
MLHVVQTHTKHPWPPLRLYHVTPAGMYWTTWIASIKDVPVAFEERVDTKQDKGMAMKVRTRS